MKKFFKELVSAVLVFCVLFSLFSGFYVETHASDYNIQTVSITGKYHQTQARKMLKKVNDFRLNKVTSTNPSNYLGEQAWAWNYSSKNGQIEYFKQAYSSLNAYTYDYELEQIAMQRAAEIAVYYGNDHTRPNNTSWQTAHTVYNPATNVSIGENIFATTNCDVMESINYAFDWWLESNDPYEGQSHRRNLLGVSVDTPFVSTAFACFEVNEVFYWVELFRSVNVNPDITSSSEESVTVDVELSSEFIKKIEIIPNIEFEIEVGEEKEIKLPAQLVTTNHILSYQEVSTGKIINVPTEISVKPVLKVVGENKVSITDNYIQGEELGKTTLTASAFGKSTDISISVSKGHINNAVVKLDSEISTYIYNEQQIKPRIESIRVGKYELKDIDYNCTYHNNIEQGAASIEIEGTGKFEGTIYVPFYIVNKENCPHYIVIDELKKPTCTIDGLTEGSHCSICGEVFINQQKIPAQGHNTEQMIIPATLDSNGLIKQVCKECGEVTEENIIYRPNVDEIIIKPQVDDLETGIFTYTGVAIVPSVIVYDTSGVQLVNGTDFVLAISNNVNVGNAKVTIRFKGKYNGSCVKQFNILPQGISISKLTSAIKSVTVGVNIVDTTVLDGYQIQYSTQTNFAAAKTLTIKDFETSQYSVKMLESAKVYYFRVRAYKTVAEMTYFSAWSAAIKIRTRCMHENFEIIDSFVQNECLGGEILVYCLDCEEEVTLYQDGLGHLPQSVDRIAPTCTQPGLSEGEKCERCGIILKQREIIPSQGHNWTEWQILNSPSCENDGLSLRICNNCNQIETLNISALGHKFAENEQYCQNGCGVVNPEYVPPHVHEFKAVKTPSTSTTLGYTTHTCSCGEAHIDTYTAPTGKLTLKHSARTNNAIRVQWNNVKTATGYQVQISSKDGKKWSTYATLKAGVTSYTFKKLAAGNNYKFRVRFYIKAEDGVNYYSPWSKTLNSPTLPAGTTLTKLTAAKKAFSAQWKKNTAVNGYQVQYSQKSNFSGAKTVTIKSNKTLKTTVKKLSAKKNYYVRIRTYKTISKVNYFSAWSKTYKFKTK